MQIFSFRICSQYNSRILQNLSFAHIISFRSLFFLKIRFYQSVQNIHNESKYSMNNIEKYKFGFINPELCRLSTQCVCVFVHFQPSTYCSILKTNKQIILELSNCFYQVHGSKKRFWVYSFLPHLWEHCWNEFTFFFSLHHFRHPENCLFFKINSFIFCCFTNFIVS